MFTCLNGVKCNAPSMQFYINQRLYVNSNLFLFQKVINIFLKIILFPTVRPSFFQHVTGNKIFILFGLKFPDIAWQKSWYHHLVIFWCKIVSVKWAQTNKQLLEVTHISCQLKIASHTCTTRYHFQISPMGQKHSIEIWCYRNEGPLEKQCMSLK